MTTRLRTIRLALHPGKRGTAWSLVLRDDNGRTVFDRRLHSGNVAEMGVLDGIADVSTCLRRIADEVDERHGIVLAAVAAREPLGAVGGGSQHRPGRVCASECPLCGEHLDGMPSDE